MARRVAAAATVLVTACLVVVSFACKSVELSNTQIVKSTDQQSNCFMGHYTKVKGEVLVAGAYGCNGYRGAVYVFRRRNERYQQEAKLTVPDARAGDYLGLNVDIDARSQSHIVAGAPYSRYDGREVGRAYVWERRNNAWVLVNTLIAPDPTRGARFGYSVAVTDVYVLIGARYAYNEVRDVPRAGAIYVYRGPKNNLELVQKLRGNAPGNHWSDEIVLSHGVLGAGAPRRRRGEGAAFIFERQSSTGLFQYKQVLTHQPPAGVPKTNRDHFGEGIALRQGGDVFIIGGERARSPGCGHSGAAYIFTKDSSGRWVQRQGLFPDSCGDMRFAQRVGIYNNMIVVGAWTHAQNGANSGAAYIYTQCNDGTWQFNSKIFMPNAKAGDNFGKSIEVSENYFVVGAPKVDSPGLSNDGAVVSYKYAVGNAPSVEDSFQLTSTIPDVVNQGRTYNINVRYSTMKTGMQMTLAVRSPDERTWYAGYNRQNIPIGENLSHTITVTLPDTDRLPLGSRVVFRFDLRPNGTGFNAVTAHRRIYVTAGSAASTTSSQLTFTFADPEPTRLVRNTRNTVRVKYFVPSSRGAVKLTFRARTQTPQTFKKLEILNPVVNRETYHDFVFDLGARHAGKNVYLRLDSSKLDTSIHVETLTTEQITVPFV